MNEYLLWSYSRKKSSGFGISVSIGKNPHWGIRSRLKLKSKVDRCILSWPTIIIIPKNLVKKRIAFVSCAGLVIHSFCIWSEQWHGTYFRRKSWRRCDIFCALEPLCRYVYSQHAFHHRFDFNHHVHVLCFIMSHPWRSLGRALHFARGRSCWNHISLASGRAAALSSLCGEVMSLVTTRGECYLTWMVVT